MNFKKVTLVTAVVVGVLMLGSLDVPTSDDAGNEIEFLPGAALKRSAAPTFRVDNYNVQRGKGEDGVRDLSRAAAQMYGADIAGIQELSGTLFYGWHNQARQLAEALQMGYLFAPTSWKWFQPYAGSALLSKFPVESWSIESLPARDDIESAHRNLITAQVKIDGRPVVLMVSHLDRRESNALQLEYVLKKFSSSQHPTILMADLNTDLDNHALKTLFQAPGVEDAILKAIGPFWRLDWIITKGFDVKGGGHTPRGISDHAHYWVDLAFAQPNSLAEQSQSPALKTHKIENPVSEAN